MSLRVAQGLRSMGFRHRDSVPQGGEFDRPRLDLMSDCEYCAQYMNAEYNASGPPVIELVESELAMSEQRNNMNERLVRLELVAELVPDVVKSTRSALKILGDMAAAVDDLAVGQSEIASRVGDLQQAIADTEQTFKETRDQILNNVHDLEIHLATIEERLATLEDER